SRVDYAVDSRSPCPPTTFFFTEIGPEFRVAQTKAADEDAAMETKEILTSDSADEHEVYVQVVVLVAYADGDLSEREETVLVDNVRKLSGNRIDDEHLKSLMVELPPLSRSSNNWRRDRVLELKKKLPNATLRNEAFRLAVEVARSDNKIG